MIRDKQSILALLRAELERWEAMLARLPEEQITARRLPSGLSIKDGMAHLMAWQQRSIARLEAAQRDQAPDYQGWPTHLDPNSEADLDSINAWIHERYRDESWPRVYEGWREGFLRFLDLAEALPEAVLQDTGRFSWLHGYSLADTLASSYEHHHDEHLEPLQAWLTVHGPPRSDE